MTRHTAYYARMHRKTLPSPPTKIDLAPNVQSNKVEKFWKEEPIPMVIEEGKTDKNEESLKFC